MSGGVHLPLNLTSEGTSDIIKIVIKYINKGEIMMVRLRNCNQNGAKNFNKVEIGDLELYFSYETCIGFRTSKTGLVVSKNIWGSTTGKHLNWIDGGSKEGRIPNDEFEKQLNELLESRGL